MISDEAAATGGTTGNTGSLPFDTSVAHQARVYDCLLGYSLLVPYNLSLHHSTLGKA